MDLMPEYTAQSPEFRQSVHDANQTTLARHQQAAGARAPPPVYSKAVLQEDDPVVFRQFIQGTQQGQRTHLRSELSDQQRERLTSAMSSGEYHT